MAYSLSRDKVYACFYITASAWRATWQFTFTATGRPAMWVGKYSIFTPRAVTSPPKP